MLNMIRQSIESTRHKEGVLKYTPPFSIRLNLFRFSVSNDSDSILIE